MSRWRTVGVFGLLFLMVAFAVFFGLTVFGNTSLRLDEAQSLFQTQRDIPGLLNLVAQDVHVPGYHTLLHYWQLLFGQDIYIARMLSLVFFVGTIIMTYVLANYALGSRRIGLFAALLVTISPFMNWYGSEARMYTMLAFMTVLNMYFFVRIVKQEGSGRWILWTVTAILGLYTHYFFILVLFSEFVSIILLRKRLSGGHVIRNTIIGGTIAGMSLLPWLLYVFSLGFASNTRPTLPEPSAGDLFDTYAQFVFGFQVPAVNTVIISLWPIGVLLAFFALQRSKREIPLSMTPFVLLATLPVLSAFLISITIKPFFLSRYLIVALPTLFIFIAWLLTRYRKWIARTVGITLVTVIGVLFAVQVISPNTPVKENYKEAVQYINVNASARDVVVVAAPFTIYPVEYYYKGDAKLTTQPIWNRFESGSVPAYDPSKVAQETKDNVSSYQHAFLMLSYDQGYNTKLKNYYDTNYQRIASRTFSPNLSVYEYKISYSPPINISP
ncbi:MAG: phospholipid carrier-dependent glycosyltransferase [Candidatus Microsaccharimonas sossegonensis]|uniref:Phospholipid carrier-dependent glycosyltransferase n=1 Tax=Candidatus Microsaccharimonas sossegonensis TaxID=2506948 RepID=A0A4V1J7D5_9BACT|nr:MAG: phospholipid carrier-dependent glycosyltransferase [Candidatus Microsaccharimonas sossegonensis]